MQHGMQYAAARVEVHSERDLGERVSFRAPAVRQLANELRWAVSVNSPVVRGVGEGVVVGCTISGEHDLTVGALDSIDLIGRLLVAAGFQAKVSDAGRWTARIVDMLGGAGSTLAAQPSIRAVLDLASREGGANPEELHNAARRFSGRWERRAVLWLRTTPYHRWVVGVLAAQRLIEGHLTYTCGACGLLQRLAPEQVQPTLTCNDCDNETPLSLQVVIGARWRLKTRRLLTSKRLRSVLPIAASLSLLGQVQRRGESANLHYSLGLDLERDSVRFEIDYAVLLQDEQGPALIVGESKARNDFDDDDVSNLETVQDAVRAWRRMLHRHIKLQDFAYPAGSRSPPAIGRTFPLWAERGPWAREFRQPPARSHKERPHSSRAGRCTPIDSDRAPPLRRERTRKVVRRARTRTRWPRRPDQPNALLDRVG